MKCNQDRREFLRLMSVGGGLVFASGLAGSPQRAADALGSSPQDDFFFLQLSDTHWGFSGAALNPEADKTLKTVVETINRSERQPDFIVFTGDLTQTTDDADVRRKRMGEFQEIVAKLKVQSLRFLPGEHDASLDRGEAYQEHFGPLHYAFDHKGVHFVALDNVSDPGGSVGERQLEWLKADLAALERNAPVVVLAHRPLFALYPEWDWTTKDGAKVIEVLQTHENVTVFYGHIHQEHHHTTGSIAHHSAKSLIFPLPAPGSVAKKAPIPWDAARPYQGLGYRRVEPRAADAARRITELPVTEA